MNPDSIFDNVEEPVPEVALSVEEACGIIFKRGIMQSEQIAGGRGQTHAARQQLESTLRGLAAIDHDHSQLTALVAIWCADRLNGLRGSATEDMISAVLAIGASAGRRIGKLQQDVQRRIAALRKEARECRSQHP